MQINSDKPTQRLLLRFRDILEAEMGHAIILVELGRVLGTSCAGETAVWCLRDNKSSPGLQLEAPPDGAGRHDGWTEVRLDERLVWRKEERESPNAEAVLDSGSSGTRPVFFPPTLPPAPLFTYRAPTRLSKCPTTPSGIQIG